MCDALMELIAEPMKKMQEEAIRTGLEQGLQQGLQKGLQQGLQQGRNMLLIEQICQKLSLQKSLEEIADELMVSLREIEPIYNIAKDFTPNYSIEEIYKKLTDTK